MHKVKCVRWESYEVMNMAEFKFDMSECREAVGCIEEDEMQEYWNWDD